MPVFDFQHFPPPRPFKTFPDVSNYLRGLYDALYAVRKGKLECVAELTLTANAASTVLTYRGLSPQSVLVFDPKTANAAAEIGNGTMYTTAANRGAGTWTITHANNAQADRSFQVAIIG